MNMTRKEEEEVEGEVMEKERERGICDESPGY